MPGNGKELNKPLITEVPRYAFTCRDCRHTAPDTHYGFGARGGPICPNCGVSAFVTQVCLIGPALKVEVEKAEMIRKRQAEILEELGGDE
jgi:hypothetical protein